MDSGEILNVKKVVLSAMIFALGGCADLGRVGMHPDVRTASFSAPKSDIENCLYSSVSRVHLSISRDAPLADGTDRFNLLDRSDEKVAWVELSSVSRKSTAMSVYYAPHSAEIKKAVDAVITRCRAEFD
ncbi:hypothetical protein ABW07_23520 [Pluralibacter gergoviae]|nr:hypothetical protein ABW07_23520 [Pluralibacter gergoviae]